MTNYWSRLLDNGSAIAAAEIDPVNLSLLTEQESRGIHSAYLGLLNQVDQPIHIHSIQTSLDLQPYAEYLRQRFSRHRDLWEDYIRYWSSFDQENLVATRHFMVVREDPGVSNRVLNWSDKQEDGSRQAVLQAADDRLREVIDSLNTGKLSAEPIDIRELQESLPQHFNAGNPDRRYVSTEPEYRRSVVVEEFPSALKLAWPLDLLRANGKIDVTQVIKPRQKEDIRSKLSKLKQRLNVELDTRLSSGVFNTKELEKALQDTDWMMEELADNSQLPVHQTIQFTVHADSQNRCDDVFNQLESQLQRLGIQYREPVFETDKALETQRLTGEPRLTEDYLLLSDAAAASLPFATQPYNAEAGVIFGEDSFDGTPILVDRFSWYSQHLARFGVTGSGKSFHAALELLRSFLAYPDLQIVVVDLKNDFTGLIKHLDGTIHSVKERPSELDDVVAFQVPERGLEKHIGAAVDLLDHLHTLTCQDDEQPTLVLVDEAHKLIEYNPDDARISGGAGRGLKLLKEWVQESRSTETAITVVTQSAAALTRYSQGEELLDQCAGKLFFRHHRVPESMKQYFDLSQQEVYDIQNLTPGDATGTNHSKAVLKVENSVNSEIRVVATPAEQSVIENQTR